GIRREPDCLWPYETDTHFQAWAGERTPSTSVNAHVLEAIGRTLDRRRRSSVRLKLAAAKVVRWLCDQQRADGSWTDKWHASPYYATVCAALALHRYGGNPSVPAVRRAVRWVVETQRPDGAWGLWQSTAEETAYAMRILLQAGGA